MRINTAEKLLTALHTGKIISVDRHGDLMALNKATAWLFSHVRPSTFVARARQLPLSMENFLRSQAPRWVQQEVTLNGALQELRRSVDSCYIDRGQLKNVPKNQQTEIYHNVAQYCMARTVPPSLEEQQRIAHALSQLHPNQHIDPACVQHIPLEHQAEIFERVCALFAKLPESHPTPEEQQRIAHTLSQLHPNQHIAPTCVQNIPPEHQAEILERVCAYCTVLSASHPTPEEQQRMAHALSLLQPEQHIFPIYLKNTTQNQRTEIFERVCVLFSKLPESRPTLRQQTSIFKMMLQLPPGTHIDPACVQHIEPEEQADFLERACASFSGLPPSQQTLLYQKAIILFLQHHQYIDPVCVQNIPPEHQAEILERVCAYYAGQPISQPSLKEQQTVATLVQDIPGNHNKIQMQSFLQQGLRRLCTYYRPEDNSFTANSIFNNLSQDIDINRKEENITNTVLRSIPDLNDRKMITILLSNPSSNPLDILCSIPDDNNFISHRTLTKTTLTSDTNTYNITLKNKVSLESTQTTVISDLYDITINITFPKNHHGEDLTVTYDITPMEPHANADVQEVRAAQ